MTVRQKSTKKVGRKYREEGMKGDKEEGWQEMCKQHPHKQQQQRQREQHTKIRSTTASILATAGTIGIDNTSNSIHSRNQWLCNSSKQVSNSSNS